MTFFTQTPAPCQDIVRKLALSLIRKSHNINIAEILLNGICLQQVRFSMAPADSSMNTNTFQSNVSPEIPKTMYLRTIITFATWHICLCFEFEGKLKF